MAERYVFHYVPTPLGTLSGKSFAQQTEDGINAVAQYVAELGVDASEAIRLATIASKDAESALSVANSAKTESTNALMRVNTVEADLANALKTVKTAESNAASALSTANAANATAGQAKTTAEAAVTTANSALGTAGDAKTLAEGASSTAAAAKSAADDAVATAERAEQTAQEARVDTEAAVAEMEKINAEAAAQAQEAKTQAQNAAASASLSEGNASLAKSWANSMENRAGEGEEPDYTVDGEEYSAKWYATQAKSNADEALSTITTIRESAAAADASAKAAATSQASATASAAAAAESASKSAFAWRYSPIGITPGGTAQASSLAPADNVKAGDHVIDLTGAVFPIASIAGGVVTYGAQDTTLKGPKGDQGEGLVIKGVFDTLDALKAGVTNPAVGDAYQVAADQNVYIWNGSAWQSIGQLGGGGGGDTVQLTQQLIGFWDGFYSQDLDYRDYLDHTQAEVMDAFYALGRGYYGMN